jgi:hypothetical protein
MMACATAHDYAAKTLVARRSGICGALLAIFVLLASMAHGGSPSPLAVLPLPQVAATLLGELGYRLDLEPVAATGAGTMERGPSLSTPDPERRSPPTTRERGGGPGQPAVLCPWAEPRLQTWRRPVAPGQADPGAAIQVTVWTVTEVEPDRTNAVVTEFRGTVADGLGPAVGLGRALDPALEAGIRRAWSSATNATGQSVFNYGDTIRFSMDRGNWRLQNLRPAVAVLIRALGVDEGREGAIAALTQIGAPAHEALRQAAADPSASQRLRQGAEAALSVTGSGTKAAAGAPVQGSDPHRAAGGLQ